MKCSLGIFNFLEGISSLSHSVVFLYFLALITEEGFLISSCYSLELCIKKRWQEYTEELYKKDLHDPDNHDGVITHLAPDILECEVKWALESIMRNKASGGYYLVWCAGFSLQWLLLLWSTGSMARGLVCPMGMQLSSWMRDQTGEPTLAGGVLSTGPPGKSRCIIFKP